MFVYTILKLFLFLQILEKGLFTSDSLHHQTQANRVLALDLLNFISLHTVRTFTLSVHVTYLHTLCTCYVPSHSLYMLRTFTLSVHVTYLHTLCTCYVPSHSLYMLRTFTLSVHVTYLHTIVLLIACTEHETFATLCHSQLLVTGHRYHGRLRPLSGGT